MKSDTVGGGFSDENIGLWTGSEAARCIWRICTELTVNYMASCQIPSLLSNLQDLEIGLPLHSPQRMVNLRKALASALLDARTSLPHLRTLRIDMFVREMAFRTPLRPDMRNEDGIDEVCEAIRLLSLAAPLRELYLSHFLLSEDLFQDCRLPAGEHDAAVWPALEELDVQFAPVSSAGKWYFTGNPSGVVDNDEYDDEEELPTWRQTIEPTTFNPLQAAFARAVLRMPALRMATLTVKVESEESLYVFVTGKPKSSEVDGDEPMAEGSQAEEHEQGQEEEEEGQEAEGDEQDWESEDEESESEEEESELEEDADLELDFEQDPCGVQDWEGDRCAQREADLKDKRALAALEISDHVVEVRWEFESARREEISRERPWNPKMFPKDGSWVPTPEIGGLWMEWVRREGRDALC